MKKRIFAIILTAALVTSMSVTAFAATGTDKYDANNTGTISKTSDSTDTTHADNTQFDVTGTVTKGDAADSGAKDYYVTVAWTTTDGSYTVDGNKYTWDASAQKYIATVRPVGEATGSTDATASITVSNYSNAGVTSTISYETKLAGTKETETTSVGKDAYSLAAYTTAADVLATWTNAEYTITKTAPAYTYAGKITLDDYTAGTTAAGTVLGTYTVTIAKAQ